MRLLRSRSWRAQRCRWIRTHQTKQTGCCAQARLRVGSTCEGIDVPLRRSVGNGRRRRLGSVCLARVLVRSYFDHGPSSGAGHGRRHVVCAKRTKHGQSHGCDPSQRHGTHADGCVSESSACKLDERRIHWISVFVAQHVSFFRRFRCFLVPFLGGGRLGPTHVRPPSPPPQAAWRPRTHPARVQIRSQLLPRPSRAHLASHDRLSKCANGGMERRYVANVSDETVSNGKQTVSDDRSTRRWDGPSQTYDS